MSTAGVYFFHHTGDRLYHQRGMDAGNHLYIFWPQVLDIEQARHLVTLGVLDTYLALVHRRGL